jgi:IclR family transcriptional regulator, KDG regulon repressor
MRTVPALDRGLQILELVARTESPVKAGDIATLLGFPRSATYELVSTLKERGYLTQDRDGAVGLGPQLFALGSRYGQSLDLAHVAQEIATSIRDQCHETVQVGTLEGREVLYIARADPERLVRLVSQVGRRLPAHCTALGKVLLAQLSPGELDERLGGIDLEALTPQSITQPEALRAELLRTRAEGLGRDDRESNPEVRCVAAPAWDATGRCAAAISISVPTERMTPEHAADLTGLVREAARILSGRLGHLPSQSTQQAPHSEGNPQ